MIQTRFPDWSRVKLETIARQHADEVALAYGRVGAETDDVDRLVVNMLRHEFTNYDDDQIEHAHRLACEAIKARCPWLGDECHRQITRRAAAEQEDAAFAEMAEHWERAEKARLEERSRDSSLVIGALKVGDEVIAHIVGRERRGTITWVGRLRVEVRYVIKTGEARTRRLYASTVRPVVAAS